MQHPQPPASVRQHARMTARSISLGAEKADPLPSVCLKEYAACLLARGVWKHSSGCRSRFNIPPLMLWPSAVHHDGTISVSYSRVRESRTTILSSICSRMRLSNSRITTRLLHRLGALNGVEVNGESTSRFVFLVCRDGMMYVFQSCPRPSGLCPACLAMMSIEKNGYTLFGTLTPRQSPPLIQRFNMAELTRRSYRKLRYNPINSSNKGAETDVQR